MINWQEIVAKYPKIDFGYYKDVVECREGWYPLIDELLSELDKLDIKLRIDQIKEKWGGLRFYVTVTYALDDFTYDKACRLIAEYEDKSYHICEVCGEPGKLHAKGWHQTLCDKHLQEYLNRK
jgi:hypothetical protein